MAFVPRSEAAYLWCIYMISLVFGVICTESLCTIIGDLCEVNLDPIGLSCRAGILL